jgi:DNA polymerase
MLAWLADEEWKLQAYLNFDAGVEKHDMYILTYAKTFNVDPNSVTKQQRSLGKVLELSMGYGGGVGGFLVFAKGYNVDLEAMTNAVYPTIPRSILEEAKDWYEVSKKEKHVFDLSEKVFIACDSLKRMWRRANPNITKLWGEVEARVRAALLDSFASIIGVGRCEVDKKGTWLRIKLPSGRYLCYAGAKILDGKIRYLGVNQYSRKWGLLSTHGAKFVENITQAAARDVLAYGLKEAENAGYKVVLSVHDELICETPDTKDFTHQGLSKLMSTNPPWAIGLPLNANGFESYRYKKE